MWRIIGVFPQVNVTFSTRGLARRQWFKSIFSHTTKGGFTSYNGLRFDLLFLTFFVYLSLCFWTGEQTGDLFFQCALYLTYGKNWKHAYFFFIFLRNWGVNFWFEICSTVHLKHLCIRFTCKSALQFALIPLWYIFEQTVLCTNFLTFLIFSTPSCTALWQCSTRFLTLLPYNLLTCACALSLQQNKSHKCVYKTTHQFHDLFCVDTCLSGKIYIQLASSQIWT